MINQIDTSVLLPPQLGNVDAGHVAGMNESFAEVFANHEAREGRDKLSVVQEESRKLVAEAFIRPILSRIRQDNNAAPPFGPTTAENRFGPMSDQVLADAMTRPDRFPMIEAVERSLMKSMNRAKGVAS